MSLKTYRSKRNFKDTPEPKDSYAQDFPALHFCVQKHAASHLHYDFRLEFEGVLLSWAVPKGPSLNPHEKRLAIKVEDHPLDYQYFEGVIPKGNYGAGTVEIWDHGIYGIPKSMDRNAVEKEVRKGLKEGHFSFVLHGEQLNGGFTLLKLKSKEVEDNSWLLIKKEDKEASDHPLIENVQNHSKTKSKSPFPNFFSPMLATLIKESFDNEDWLFEIKWDGFRALAFITPRSIQLKSRNDHILNDQFPSIVKELMTVKSSLILDGELVVLDEKGRSDFQLMQNYQLNQKGTLFYYVFDLLYKDGQDLRSLPLLERKENLKRILVEYSFSSIGISDHIIGKGIDFFNAASKASLEGIIGKRKESVYVSKRSKDWVKIKTSLRQEFIIGGFTAPRGSRKKFGALLIGLYDENKELIYSGHVGSGFSEMALNFIFDQLSPLVQKKCPFKVRPKENAAVTWVSPKQICEVSFSEWTNENLLRHPIFQGLRADKQPKTIKKEIPTEVRNLNELNVQDKLLLTHLDKIFWPKEKFTKGELLSYYQDITDFILPYLKDRPITLYRFPNGIENKGFYQKNLQNHPEWIQTFPIRDEQRKIDHYLLINDKDSLLYAVNLGCIDFHPFLSRVQSLDKPDYCVVDIDPHDINFSFVVEVAQRVHQLLEKIEVEHFCKTSGGKGLHILIPFQAKYTYTQSQQFAELICQLIHREMPESTSLERSPQKRPNKIYLDYLQNRRGQTIVAPYSIRPRPGILISTPLEWDEVNIKLNPAQFTIKTVEKRLKAKGDLLKEVFTSSIDLNLALKKLKRFL